MRAFWLLVIAPLAVAGYLAVRVSTEGAELRRHEVQTLLDGRLADVRTRASQAFAAIDRELDARLAEAPVSGAPLVAATTVREDNSVRRADNTRGESARVADAGAVARPRQAADDPFAQTHADRLRTFGRRIALARQLFVLDASGRLVYPAAADATAAERDFLERTASIWNGRAILDAGGGGEPRAQSMVSGKGGVPGVGDSLVDLAARRPTGWLAWYWAEGLHLLYWRRAPDGGVIGVELERVGVLARIVGALPTGALEDGRMELADSRGQTVHQWGPMIPAEGALPAPADASIALEPPLESWQLRYHIAPNQRAALAGGLDTGWFFGLGAIGVALLVLAFVVYRAITQRLREAAARVGFVTRVSHELRTPLTNIRMYAELIEDDATAEEDEPARRARVIIAESQRLGRLIDNVLAFARHQRGTLATRAERVDVDAVVRDTVAKFAPALDARSITVTLVLSDPPAVRGDADAVDQIVANLLSNVEKYAAAGGAVTIATRAANGHVIVSIADRGPGVAAPHRDAIFEPFHRTGDSLTGANGTGIGLAISRELARSAGGDLALATTEQGACFELTLPVAGDPP